MHECWWDLPEELVDYIFEFVPIRKKPINCFKRYYREVKLHHTLMWLDDWCVIIVGVACLMIFLIFGTYRIIL